MLNLALANLLAMASEKSMPYICKFVTVWPNSFSKKKVSDGILALIYSLT